MTAPAGLNIRIAAFDEASPVIRLTRDQVERFASGLRAGMGQAERSVVTLTEWERRLAEQHHLGRLSADDYGRALITLKADISELAHTTTLSVTEQEKLARVARTVDQNLTSLSRAQIRTVDAADLMGSSVVALSQVVQGNVGALSSWGMQLQRFTIGSPMITGLLGAATALVVAWVAVEQAANKAEDAERQAHERRAGVLGAVRLTGADRAAGMRRLAVSGREELAGMEGGEREVPFPVVRRFREGTVVVNQADIDAAQQFNDDLVRRRTIIGDLVQLAEIDAARAERSTRGARDEAEALRDLSEAQKEALRLRGSFAAAAERWDTFFSQRATLEETAARIRASAAAAPLPDFAAAFGRWVSGLDAVSGAEGRARDATDQVGGRVLALTQLLQGNVVAAAAIVTAWDAVDEAGRRAAAAGAGAGGTGATVGPMLVPEVRAIGNPLELREFGIDLNVGVAVDAARQSFAALRSEVRLFAVDAKDAGEIWSDMATKLDATIQAGTMESLTALLSGTVGGLGGFGKQMAGVLGQVLITAGQSAIGIGTFAELIRRALSNIFGGGGIAAVIGGAALIALGARIRGAAGGVANQISTGFGGGSVSSGGGSASEGFAGAAERGTTIVEVPSDNAILGARNPAFVEWLVAYLEQIGERNVIIRTATP